MCFNVLITLFSISLIYSLSHSCDDNWKKAFNAFRVGILAFPVLLGTVGWVVFWSHKLNTVIVCSVIIMLLAAILMWSFRNIMHEAKFLAK